MKDTKRARKAEQVELYLKQVGRPAQKGHDPNDRRYDRDVERKLRQMSPLELDSLLRPEDEEGPMLQMKSGDLVLFVGDIEPLLASLPAEESQAIRDGMKQQPFRVAAFMADGSVEIELPLGSETHFFYVSATDLQPKG